jgi:vitamin K-dependent gamma-carboxylase-like protein
MVRGLRRWSDEVGDTHALGAARVALGVLLFANALRAARELKLGYFGDVFHWPVLPEAFVPERSVYALLVMTQVLLSAFVVAGSKARGALFASAVIGVYVLLCDRLAFHNNRAALFFYSFLLSFSPCDRAFSVAPTLGTINGPLWAARLAQFQLSFIYVASGGSKLLDDDWRSGRVLFERFVLFGSNAVASGVPDRVVRWVTQPDAASALAKIAIATELALAVGLWSRRTRTLALWWGVWFHLAIEISSQVEGFTWLTLSMYALFATPDLRARRVYYDPYRWRSRVVARGVMWLDWLGRFEVKPWAPDNLRSGHSMVVIRRDGTLATGLGAVAMLTRCIPVLFPLWAPTALAASFTRGGDASARS